MVELIIFLISAFFIYFIISSLIIRVKGGKLGCFSFIVTILLTYFISVAISQKLNPNKAEPFFNRERITKKVDDYKSEYLRNNKNYLNELSKNNYYNFSNSNNIKDLKIGCLCREGNIVSSVEKNACSDYGGIYQLISVEIDKYEPPKLEYNTNYKNPEISSSGGPVYVRGYFRKDGTYVRPHTRRLPRR
ncbi:hypothetical protein [Soonwooa sp.]|uniref:hypothetical protein n=1 Tax=Soonwooa sp. TaxID=1938592 RepID=UPI00289F326E|nr:hypothetical protein [Soonwooa sp.]